MTTNLMEIDFQKTDEIKQVSTFHPSLPRSIYPISKYRYQWKFSDQIEPNEKIITETETIGIFTVDIVYYEGDKDNLELQGLLNQVRNEFERHLPHDFDFSRLRKTKKGYHKYDIHYTVTFNTCEKWGVCETLPYVEITKSSDWGQKREDRSRSELCFKPVEQLSRDTVVLTDEENNKIYKLPMCWKHPNRYPVLPKTSSNPYLLSTEPNFSYSNVVNFREKMKEVYKDDYSVSDQFKKDILDLSSIMESLDKHLNFMKKNSCSWGEPELGDLEFSYEKLTEKCEDMIEKLNKDFLNHQPLS